MSAAASSRRAVENVAASLSSRVSLSPESAFRFLVVAALLTAAAGWEAFRLSVFSNTGVWVHLRTGLWILQNHSVPQDGLFSQHASLPWIDASWGFDLLTGFFYRTLGLRGLPVLLMLFEVAIAAALLLLAQVSVRNFWKGALLTAAALFSLSPLHLRPALCSIVFLSIELTLLFRARQSGDLRPLFYLPLLFVLWANLDRQFVYGLAALGLLLLAVVVENSCRTSNLAWLQTALPELSHGRLAVVLAACLLATLASPYTYHLLELVWRSASSNAIDQYLQDFHSMRFRQPQNYALMLLAMVAFFSIGRKPSGDLFPLGLMIVSCVISFRLQRDAWLVVVASVGVIANALSVKRTDRETLGVAENRWAIPICAVLTGVVLAALILRIPAGTEKLLAKVGESFPVRASEYIRQNHLPKPLFNSYPWGSFLTWYLPDYPVAIDERLDLYSDAVNIPYFRLMSAKIALQELPDFEQARTILMEADSPIAQALAALPGFRVVYQDDQASVVVREN